MRVCSRYGMCHTRLLRGYRRQSVDTPRNMGYRRQGVDTPHVPKIKNTAARMGFMPIAAAQAGRIPTG